MSSSSRSGRWRNLPGIVDHGKHPDLSAFLVIAWCIFYNASAFKVSAVIRTIAADSTIYFLAMVAVQVYSLLSFVFMEVQSLSLGLHLIS